MHEFPQAALIRRARLPLGTQNQRTMRLLRLLFLGLIVIPAVAAAQISPPPTVLILHSYHFGYDWTEGVAAGIRSAFQENTVVADFHVEFMDARRLGSPADLERLHDYYKQKFQNLNFDVIISSDNAALEFLLQNHHTLFPQTPVVFCGVYHEGSRQRHGPGIVHGLWNRQAKRRIDLGLQWAQSLSVRVYRKYHRATRRPRS